MPPVWLTIPLIIIANWLTGWVIVRRVEPTLKASFVTSQLVRIVTGVVVNGWMALVLAEFGRFNLPTLALIWLLAILLIAPKRVYGIRYTVYGLLNTEYRILYTIMLICWLVVASWLFFRPHEFVRGGADAGVYVNLAANIANTGRILIDDPTLAELDPVLYPNLLRVSAEREYSDYTILPGFFVGDNGIIPQFYPQHPVWQAVAFALGGVDAALALNGLWALLAVLVLYQVGRDLGGKWVGGLVLAGMTFNALQIWFARYPTTEPLTQLLVWAGIWGLMRWLKRDPSLLWPLLTGLGFGSAMLVRIDMFFLLAVPLVLAIYFWSVGEKAQMRQLQFFIVPFGILTVHSFAHAWWQSRPYFWNTFGTEIYLLQNDWPIVLLGGVLGIVGLVVFGRILQTPSIYKPILTTIIVTILILAIYAWFFRPNAPIITWNDPFGGNSVPILDHENFVRLGWYLSPVGIWLGVIGTCWLIWRIKPHTAPVIAIGLFFTLLYLWRIKANPHQIYAMRRYVPVALPFFILSTATIINAIRHKIRTTEHRIPYRRVAKNDNTEYGLSVILTLLWLGGLLYSAQGFITQINDVGSAAQIVAISDQLAPNSILLFNDPNAVGQGDIMGTTLRFQHNHDVFTLRNPDSLDQIAFERQIEQWIDSKVNIYWFDIPDGHAWPSDQHGLSNPQPYTLEFSFLETTYERKPQVIVDVFWAGTIYEVTR